MKKKIVLLLLLFLSSVLWASQCLAQESKAQRITGQCAFSFTSEKNKSKIKDGKNNTEYCAYGEGEQYIEIDFLSNEVQGIYIKWAKPAAEWTLCMDFGAGFTQSEQLGNKGFVQEYIALPDGIRRVRIGTEDVNINSLNILEIEVYGQGVLPERVHMWEPTPSIAELMVISAHQDDELLFFGGTIPYYAGEKKYDTVVVYMGFETGARLHEALEGMWICGLRQHPVFLCLPDVYAENLSEAKEYWSEDEVTDMLTDQLLKYRPQVIVTHDEEGEYGHGQHILTVECLKRAIVNAASEEWVEKNTPDMQMYSVPKCYFHMYSNNRVVLPWDTLYITKAGKTAYRVAVDAFREHISQWETGFRVYIEGKYDSRNYGLYHSTVGYDTEKNDFFENICLRIDDAAAGELPANVEKSTEIEKAYTYTDPVSGNIQMLRYGISDDEEGWYCSDETGAPVLPVTAFNFFLDEAPDALGETINKSDEQSLLYVYRNEKDSDGVLMRFGTWKDVTGWFACDENGKILSDRPMEPLMNYYAEDEASAESDVSGPEEINESAVPFASIITTAAAITAVAVIMLLRKKRV